MTSETIDCSSVGHLGKSLRREMVYSRRGEHRPVVLSLCSFEVC